MLYFVKQYDGGGPLVCEAQDGSFPLIGCVQDDAPRVYTKVPEFYDWIQHNTIY